MIYVCRECVDCSCIIGFSPKFPDDEYRDPEVCPWGGTPAIWKPLELQTDREYDHNYKTSKNGVRCDYSKELAGG